MRRLYQVTAVAVLGVLLGPVPVSTPPTPLLEALLPFTNAEAGQRRRQARPPQRPRVIVEEWRRYPPPRPQSSYRNYYGPAPTIRPPMQRVPQPAPLAEPPINR